MVQAIAFSRHRIRVRMVKLCHRMKQAAGSITNPKGKIIAHIPKRLGNHPRRIGKIKNLNMGSGIFSGQFAVFYQRRHGAHSKGKACRSGSLLSQDASSKRGSLISYPHFIAAHTNGRDEIVRTFNRIHSIRGQTEFQFRPDPFCHLLRHSPENAQLLLIMIHKDDLLKAQSFTVLRKAFGQKHGAYAPASNYCYLHSSLLIQVSPSTSLYGRVYSIFLVSLFLPVL